MPLVPQNAGTRKDAKKVRVVSDITPDMPRVSVDPCAGATFFGSQVDVNTYRCDG